MSATTEHPKVFIAYSWANVEHEQFVMDLSTSLRNHGVDAILDKWNLKPGQDKYVSVESMVVDIRAALPPEITCRLEFAPGEAAQVDFGAGPILQHPDGKPRRTWAFVMPLA